MKIYVKLLALCGVVGSSTAFVPLAPKALKGSSLASTIPQGDTITSPGPALEKAIPTSTDRTVDDEPVNVHKMWESLSPFRVQGGALRTWTMTNPDVERVQVLLKTEGRRIDANVELWQGPDRTPQRLSIGIGNGGLRPISLVLETPTSSSASAIAVRNTGNLEFPVEACVEADVDGAVIRSASAGIGKAAKKLAEMGIPRTVQGGSVISFGFEPQVASVLVLLKTDGRPLHAKVEAINGPNSPKQVIDIYSEEGYECPFFAVLQTPKANNVVRIVNTASQEFPFTACVEPYLVETYEPVAPNSHFVVTGGA